MKIIANFILFILTVPLLFAQNNAVPFESGLASHYSTYYNNKTTAFGVKLDPNSLSAAHRYLPMGARVRVVNKLNNKSVEIVINDRGPFDKPERILDLSFRAASELGFIEAGTTPIDIYTLTDIPEYMSKLPSGFELWTVQVTSVQDLELAKHHATVLGDEATIREVHGQNGYKSYRVYYGRYLNRASTALAQQDLALRGYSGTLIKYLVDDYDLLLEYVTKHNLSR